MKIILDFSYCRDTKPMKLLAEMKLKDFRFWGGAEQIFESLTKEEFDFFEQLVEDNDEPWEEIKLNNLVLYALEEILKKEGIRKEDD